MKVFFWTIVVLESIIAFAMMIVMGSDQYVEWFSHWKIPIGIFNTALAVVYLFSKN